MTGPGAHRWRRAVGVGNLWTTQPGLRRGYIVDVLTAAALGALTLKDGYAVTHGPAWDTLNANGGPVVWGAVLLALAAVCVVASFIGQPAMMCALVAAATLYGLFGLWFLTAYLDTAGDPFAPSAWGFVLCLRAAIMHASRAWAYKPGGE